jgi:hypothetical protein
MRRRRREVEEEEDSDARFILDQQLDFYGAGNSSKLNMSLH